MKEDNKHIDFIELCSKYLSNNANELEVQQLEKWVLSSPENKAQFLKLQRAWMLTNVKKTDQTINLDKEWETIDNQLFKDHNVIPLKPRKANSFFLKIAAAAAVFLAASLWFFQSRTAVNTKLVVESDHQVKEEQFADGTKVSLNQFSLATYFDRSDNTRQVALRGDAFFDVARDTSHPFIIHTQGVKIEVLGTSFYVDSREDQAVLQVIVNSGTVQMKMGEQTVLLTKGEVGTYVKSSQQLSEKLNNDANYLSWKNNQLLFDDANLEQVIYDLNRTFHSQIKLASPDLKTCSITATYENKSLEAILRIIEKTLTLKAEINGDQIVISGDPCN